MKKFFLGIIFSCLFLINFVFAETNVCLEPGVTYSYSFGGNDRWGFDLTQNFPKYWSPPAPPVLTNIYDGNDATGTGINVLGDNAYTKNFEVIINFNEKKHLTRIEHLRAGYRILNIQCASCPMSHNSAIISLKQNGVWSVVNTETDFCVFNSPLNRVCYNHYYVYGNYLDSRAIQNKVISGNWENIEAIKLNVNAQNWDNDPNGYVSQASYYSYELKAFGDSMALDSGLRVYDGTQTIKLARDDNSKLKIYNGAEKVGIALVSIGDAFASKIRIMTDSGVMALKKL